MTTRPPSGEQLDSIPLDAKSGAKLPLHAFSVLLGGDVFEVVNGAPPKDGADLARQYVATRIRIESHGVSTDLIQLVQNELVTQLKGNPQLVARLEIGRPLIIDIVPQGRRMATYGFPPHVSAHAAGLFWDSPAWPEARIALMQTSLEKERVLVTHEMAHAINRLAFTKTEQESIYRLMLPVYKSRSAVDEVFAIYSEREFVGAFNAHEGQAPGVYGLARRRWDERHVFTRFVRLLYHPHKPLAGSARTGPKHLLGL